MKHRNDNMLLRIAQGDAYAMACEYVNRDRHPELYDEAMRFERYLKHPTHRLAPGMYTDDTQMSIAVTEALINDASGCFWDGYLSQDVFASLFYGAFKRDPRDGYSRGFQKLLESSKTLDELMTQLVPDSNKNGAAMRAVPIGVLAGPIEVLQVAEIQAKVTHNTPGGIQSAQAVALMSHYAIYTDDHFSDLPEWGSTVCPLFERFYEDWEGPVQGNRSNPNDLGVGVNTAHAVCTLLRSENSLLGIMQRLLEWGGDTDSVAAIAWGIASARYPDEALPEFFEHCLEPGGQYGPAYLKGLGLQLMNAYDLRKEQHDRPA